MKKFVLSNRIKMLSMFSIMAMLVSCNKDEVLSENEELLTAQIWYMTAHAVDPAFPVIDGENNSTIYINDIYEFMGNCYHDDNMKFNSDKSVIIDEGKLKCDETTVQQQTGEWLFNTEETTLTIVYNGIPEEYSVQELTTEVLKLKITSFVDNVNYSHTITFSH